MSYRNFSMREIQDGKEFMRKKEFWLVYNNDDNHSLLQAILDTYYNEYPNTYSADIIDHQNSSRIIVKCNVCNGKELSSYDPFVSHSTGKNHKKNLVELQVASENSSVDRPILIFLKPEDIDNPFESGTLEFDLFETNFDIIGFQFLYREITNEGKLITCQLCSRDKDKYKHMEPSKALRHMQSKSHQNSYLIAKFDIKDSTLQNEAARQSFITDVVKKEGKLLHKILTIDHTTSNEGQSSSKDGKDLDKNKIIESVGAGTSKDPKNPETPEQFLEIIQEHLKHLDNKAGDNVIDILEKDEEAMDLIISTGNVLAQKIQKFSKFYDNSFKEYSRKFMERCENIKLPHMKESK